MLEEDIIAELGCLPKKLSDLYEIAYQRITNSGPRSRELAERALKWLLCANRTLQTSEFIAAISVDTAGRCVTISSTDVLNVCCNMVVLDVELDIYRFAHLSVREYLESRDDYTSVKLNERATERCLDAYVSKADEVPQSTLVTTLNHTLRPYTALYWPVHLLNAGGDDISASVMTKVKLFLFGNDTVSSRFELWSSDAISLSRSLSWEDPLKEKFRAALLPATPLFLGCTFGWVFIIEHLSTLTFNAWDQRNNTGSSGLHIASGYGHTPVVRLLLEKGADVESKGPYGKTALCKAATYGHEDVVCLLLEYGANVESQDHDGTTALHRAASSGHVTVARILLKHSAQIEAKGTYGKTALYLAAQNEHESVVRLLLQKGADANKKSSDGNTALHSAARVGHEGITKLLLENGSDVDVRDSNGKTALDVAAWGDHEPVIRLLLEHGADVEAKGKYGESALYRAVWSGRETIVKLLLEYGASVGAKSNSGETVLYRAIYDGREGIVRLLLEHVTADVAESWSDLLRKSALEGIKVSEEMNNRMKLHRLNQKTYSPNDFQIQQLIGRGRLVRTVLKAKPGDANICAGTSGQVYIVKKKDSLQRYAMKVLSKKVLVNQRRVAHILGARDILVRTAIVDSPFIVNLKFSFQTPEDLYLVTEYMAGGELFWYLQKEGRFSQNCAKFYIAEIILALQHLHQHNITFGNLRPEKILLDEEGHIALCDFGQYGAGLNPRGNILREVNEYTAPECLLEETSYTKMVDYWSLGVLSFEMICGWSPFYADDNEAVRKNIAFGKVRFPRDCLDFEGRNFIKGLLNRKPLSRLGSTTGAEDLKSHPFLAEYDWPSLGKKKIKPPLKPTLLSEEPWNTFPNEAFLAATKDHNSLPGSSTPLSPSMQANFKGFTFVDETDMDVHFKQLETHPQDFASSVNSEVEGKFPFNTDDLLDI